MADESQNPRLPSALAQGAAMAPRSSRALAPEGLYQDRMPDADIREIGAALRRRRWSMLLVFLVVFGAATALALLWPKTYQSSALVLVEQRTPRSDAPAFAVLERLGYGSQIETEMELIESRRVVERLVDQLDLQVLVRAPRGKRRPADVFPAFDATPAARPGAYRFGPVDNGLVAVTELGPDTLVARVERDFEILGVSGRLPDPLPDGGIEIAILPLARAVAMAQGQIAARRVGRQADLVRVTCDGASPTEAFRLCKGTLEDYVSLRTELQRTEAKVTAKFLREQGERVGAQLASAEDSLEEYGRANRVVALQEQATEEVKQYTALKAQRDQLEAERAALAEMIRDIEAGEGGTQRYRDLASFPTLLRNDAVTEMLTSLIELENRRSDLVTRRSETNADVVALDVRIHDLERQLRRIAVSYEEALRSQIGTLDGTLASTAGRLAIIPTQQVQYARLERKVGLLDDLYRVLEARLREAEVAEAVELPSVRVVDEASLPYDPARPKVPLAMALGFVLAMVSGLGVALFREMKDTRVRERHEVERHTGLPVLTVLPHLRRPGPVMPLPPLSRTGRPSQGILQPRVLQPKTYRPTADKQVALECFRSLAADLGFAARANGNGGFQTVAVTSPGRGEGKTLTACNLALVRAADGVRTLLVDGDMRAGQVARFFDFPGGGPGLSNVLAGNTDVGAVWRGVVGQSELWVVPAGSPTANTTSLLGSTAFARIIDRARARFDLIIIDTPPLNMMSDAATVAAAVDAVVVVVREGRTEHEALEMTLARLERAGGNVVGVVMNDVAMPKDYSAGYQYASATTPT